MPIRFALARRTAQELLELLEQAKITSPPVPVETLVKLAGARIRFAPFDEGELSGMIIQRGTGPAVIGVNARHPKVRQRFTIAHELGHLLLHPQTPVHVDKKCLPVRFRDQKSATGDDAAEVEANQFAAALLMPEDMVLADLLQHEGEAFDEEDLRRLAERYEVSVAAMTIRLSALRLVA